MERAEAEGEGAPEGVPRAPVADAEGEPDARALPLPPPGEGEPLRESASDAVAHAVGAADGVGAAPLGEPTDVVVADGVGAPPEGVAGAVPVGVGVPPPPEGEGAPLGDGGAEGEGGALRVPPGALPEGGTLALRGALAEGAPPLGEALREKTGVALA